jgi:CO/xanthine dehydrogenase Mo-binding subunit
MIRPNLLLKVDVAVALSHGALMVPFIIASAVFVDAVLLTIGRSQGVKGIRADSAVPSFRRSIQPILAYEKVRHVGEPLAACVADTRAEAEDIAEQISLDLEELPAIAEMTPARDPAAPLIHERWSDAVMSATKPRSRTPQSM